jgi:hypothetical protein
MFSSKIESDTFLDIPNRLFGVGPRRSSDFLRIFVDQPAAGIHAITPRSVSGPGDWLGALAVTELTTMLPKLTSTKPILSCVFMMERGNN